VRANHLAAALDRGEASWADVDAAVEHLVETLLRFDEVLALPPAARSVVGSARHRSLAREVAARSVVLLRNETVDGAPALPLDPGSRLAVIGKLAGSVNLGDGGSSDVWDLDCRTVLDGLRAAVADVVHDDGSDPTRAAGAAAGAAAAVVVAGYTYLDEGEYIGVPDPELGALFPQADEPAVVAQFRESLTHLPDTTAPERVAERPKGAFGLGGDRSSLHLHDSDVELIRAVAAANPRTVVVIQASSAVVVTEWVDDVAAVVQAWYGGCEAGPGLADVLLGDVNPSGRLPFSVPVDEADLPHFDRDATSFRYDRWHGWWHLARAGRAPAFPFGFGLAYTTFELGDVDVSRDGDAVVARGVVRNTGGRDGADVVQVYAELPDADAPSRLVGFARVEAPAAGQASFEVRVPVARFATRDPENHTWRPASGRHVIAVARHAADPAAPGAEVDL